MELTNIETVGVICLEFLPLGGGIRSGQTDVGVSSIQALGQVHLGTLWSGNGQLRDT